MECFIEDDCLGMGKRRMCGHVACDEHTDDAADVCLLCVAVDQVEYAEQVAMAQEAAGEASVD